MRWWVLLGLMACSGGEKAADVDDTDLVAEDDTDPGGGDALPTFDAFCAEASDLYADHLVTCFPDGDYAAGTAGGDAFRQRMRDACALAVDAADGGRAAYDATAARTCLASARAEANACRWDFSGFTHPACDAVFAPLVPLGGACSGAEGRWLIFQGTCAEGWCDDRETCPGACAPYAAVGASCADAPCDPAVAWCFGAEERSCVPFPATGAACDDGVCGPGDRCAGDVCVPIAVVGDTCGDDRVCASVAMACDDGVCDLHVAAGAPCRINPSCTDGLVCRDADGDGQTTCEARGDVGARCVIDVDCVDAAWCDAAARTCVARAAVEASCADAPCVDGAWCREPGKGVPTCWAPQEDGQDCWEWYGPSLDADACQPGSLCMDDGVCHPVGGDGDPCAVTQPSCLPGLTCDRASVTCVPAGDDGDACNPFDPEACAAGLGCACEGRPEQCAAGDTVAPQAWHVCAPLKPEGAVCWAWAECASGLCDPCADGDCDVPGLCVIPEEDCAL